MSAFDEITKISNEWIYKNMCMWCGNGKSICTCQPKESQKMDIMPRLGPKEPPCRECGYRPPLCACKLIPKEPKMEEKPKYRISVHEIITRASKDGGRDLYDNHTIYEQTVEELDLQEVIQAVNSARTSDVSERWFHTGICRLCGYQPHICNCYKDENSDD